MDVPSSTNLADARPIDLTRAAGSPEAASLADAVITAIKPYIDRKRPVGPAGLVTMQVEVGTILAGLLRASFKSRVVAAQRRFGGPLWKYSPVLGNRAFWRKVDAMVKAGLVDVRAGIQVWAPFHGPGFDGKATRLWATTKLVELAASFGITSATVGQDWPVSKLAEMVRPDISHGDLVVCRALDGDRPAELPPDQVGLAETMRDKVAALNEAANRATIRGCLAPGFHRVFRHDLHLGGRLYAVGANNVQTMSEADRRAITINGEPVTELDVSASQLSIFLALTGGELPDRDLYDVGGLPRHVVKAWVVQTLATGSPIVRWSDRTPVEARGVKPRIIYEAMATAYPAFRQPLRSIVPPDILGQLPEDRHGWAVGQYLTFRESQAVSAAIGYVLAHGSLALPVHDSILVPKSATASGLEGLTRSFVTLVGIYPRLTVSSS